MHCMHYIKGHINIFIQTNAEEVASQNRPTTDVILDGFKAYIRGVMLGFAAKSKANLNDARETEGRN